MAGPQRSHGGGGPSAQGGSSCAPVGDSPSPHHHPGVGRMPSCFQLRPAPLSWDSLTQQEEQGGKEGRRQEAGGSLGGTVRCPFFSGDLSVCPWGGGDFCPSEVGSPACPSGSVSFPPSSGFLHVLLMALWLSFRVCTLVHLGCPSTTTISRSSLHCPPHSMPSKHVLDATSTPLS